MTAIYLERREPACNLQRFYAIAVTQTLSGGWVLVRERWFIQDRIRCY